MSLLSFTQVNFPRLIVNDGDSLVIQTVEQTRWVSKQLEIGKACEKSGIQKDSMINRHVLNEKHLMEVISIKNELISSKDSTIADKDTIVGAQKNIITDLNKENKGLKIKNTLILIGSGIITTLTILLALL